MCSIRSGHRCAASDGHAPLVFWFGVTAYKIELSCTAHLVRLKKVFSWKMDVSMRELVWRTNGERKSQVKLVYL
jgi:hypothetical protein